MRTKEKSIAIVLGGGKGTRLYPLTMDRAKPAVPFAGKYRLVDIPISNCINSGIRQIYILTQFNSASLHNHIANTYIFGTFSNGFVEILAAEQTNQTDTWYQGTADAVRKNFVTSMIKCRLLHHLSAVISSIAWTSRRCWTGISAVGAELTIAASRSAVNKLRDWASSAATMTA